MTELTLTEARHDTCAKDMKDNTNPTTDLHIDKAADNKINSEPSNLPKVQR